MNTKLEVLTNIQTRVNLIATKKVKFIYFKLVLIFAILCIGISLETKCIAEESKASNILLSQNEVIKEINIVKNLLSPVSGITTIDLTNTTVGGDVNHTHITQREFDANYHWERCWKCNQIVNKTSHNMGIAGRSYCGSGVSAQQAYCTDGCGYTYSIAKPSHVESEIRPDGSRPLHYKYCLTCGDWVMSARCKNAAGEIIGCDTGISGTCVECGRYWNAERHAVVQNFMESDTFGYVECEYCRTRMGSINLVTYDDTTYQNSTLYTCYIYPYSGFSITSDGGSGSCSAFETRPTYSSNMSWNGSAYVVNSRVDYNDDCSPKTTDFHTILYYTYGSTSNYSHIRFNSKADNWAPKKNNATSSGSGSSGNYSVKATVTAIYTDWASTNNVVYMRLIDKDKNTVLSDWGAASHSGSTYTRIFDVCAEIREPSNIYVQARDASGNITVLESGAITVQYIDTLAPRLTSGGTSTTEWSKSKQITYVSEDKGIGDVQIAFNETIDYQYADKNGDIYSRTYNFIGDVYGTQEAALYLKDKLGNDRMVRVKVSNLDNTAPTITSGSIDKKVVSIQSHDRHATLGEGSGVVSYRYMMSSSRITNPSITTSNSTLVTGKSTGAGNFSVSDWGNNRYIYVSAVDAVGNIGTPREIVIPSYTVTYDYRTNGGTSSTKTSDTLNYGNSVDLTPTAARTGYTFVGWNTNKDATTRLTSLTMETSNITLYAIFKPNIYTIVYNGNGATEGSMANSSYTYDSAKNLTSNGYRRKYTVTYNHNYVGSTNASQTTEYIYNGWATSATGAKVYDNNQSVINLTTVNNATVNLYANWTATSVNYTPMRIGYIFDGWYTESSVSGTRVDTNGTYTPSSNITLYAKWIPITYTIKYYGNESTEGNTVDSIHTYDEAKNLTSNGYKRKYIVTYNHNYVGSTDISKTAEYIYRGWSTRVNGEKVYDDKQSVINLTSKDKDIINLYAIWEPTSVNYTPTRIGYKFDGWYSEPECKNQITPKTDTTYTPSKDITLYAKWIPITYTIKYNGNGATEGSTEDSIHTYDIAKTLTPNRYRRLYTVTYNLNFDDTFNTNKIAEYIWRGWATSEDGEKVYDDEQNVVNLTIIDKDIINLYAVWEPTSVDYTPTRVGYKFCGWYKEPECINQITTGEDTTYIPTEDITLYAKWKIVEYTVRYNGNGATEGNTEDSYHTYGIAKALTPNGFKRKYTVTYNLNYEDSKNIYKTAEYKFNGWLIEDDERKEYDDKQTVINLTIKDEDIVNLYANWNQTSVDYTPTRTGHTFCGWYKEPECINQVTTGEDTTIIPTEDTTLYAKWEKNTYKYKIEYYYDGIIDESKTVIKEAKYHDVIHEFEDKKIPGYRLMITEEGPNAGLYDLEDGAVGISLTITEKEEQNIIRVYYVKDDGQTKDLSYTVEYYKDNKKVEEDTKIVSKTVYILNPDTITVNKALINPDNKYLGYKLSNTDEIPDIVNNGDVIKLYYIIDESQTKEISYTVEYYKDNEKVEEDTKVIKETVHVLEPDTLNVDRTLIDNTNKYDGYKLLQTEPEEVSSTVNSGTILKVYYVVDESQTKELSYTIEYYKDSEKVEEDTKVIKETVQILEPDMLQLDKTLINNSDKYFGYKIEKAELDEIPDMVNNGDVIKIYYVIDESQTKELSYTIEYYKDGEKVEEDTKVIRETVQVLQSDTLRVDRTLISDFNKYPGYGIERTKPEVVADIVSNGSIIKVYYVKGPIRYTIRYYYDGVLNESETEVGYASLGDIITTYENKEKYGYKFEKIEGLPLTITAEPGENIIKVYYTRKTAEVEIKFIDKATGEEIETKVITGNVFDRYDVSYDVEIPGYTLVESPNRVTGTFTEEKQEKEFYYAKNTNLVIKYLEQDETPDDDTDNVVLAESDVIQGYEGKEYATSPKEIEGYSCVGSSENTTGEMTVDPVTEVIYYYEKNAKVIVNHIDKNTGETLETIEYEGKVGSTYTAKAKDFDNYILDERPEEETVVITKEDIVLNYYYVQVSAGVIEKHIDIKTNEILEQTLYEGTEGDTYRTETKEFEGYDLVEEEYPENTEGTMTVELIEVKYYYIRKASVVVKYIDKATGEEILEDNITSEEEMVEKNSTEYIYGHEGDEYTTEPKEFEGYDLVEVPKNAEGTMKVALNEDGTVNTELEVIYYYSRKAEVIERHIDVKTEELLEEETRYEGHEGDEYEVKEKEFEGYDLVEEKYPENSKGTMSTDVIIVNYYYVRKASVKVEYIDIKTGEKILEIEETDSTQYIYGHEGDEYKAVAKELERYDLVEIPENSEGVMKVTLNEDGTVNTEIEVVYYYIRKVKVVVEHVELETGDKVAEDEIIEGHEGDEYHTESKEIDEYNLLGDKIPENKDGVMEDEDIVVTYYYEKIDEEKPNPPIDDDNNKPDDSNNSDNNNNNNDKPNNNNTNTDTNNNNSNSTNVTNNNSNTNSNNNSVIVINNNSNSTNNKVNTSNTNTTSKNNTTSIVPSTGDMLVIIATGIIIFVILLNVVVTIFDRKKK